MIILFTSAIYGFIGYYLSFFAGKIISDSVWVDVIQYYPLSVLIVTNLHWLALAQIIFGSIALYAKVERGQYE